MIVLLQFFVPVFRYNERFSSDILYGIAAYLIALLIFSMIYDRLKKSEADEAVAPSAPEEYSIISED